MGYDEKRPSRRDYTSFLNRFSSGLEDLNEEGISLMIYRSYVRQDCKFGRSDIDALLILPGEIVIDKEILNRTYSVFVEAKKGNTVPFQVTVSDLRTMQEGTFNTYQPNFKEYFDSEGEVVVGKDFRSSFNFQLPRFSDQDPLRFNLRKSRIGLFFSEYDKQNNYLRFLEKFSKSLNAVSRGSKQVLHLMDRTVRKSRFSALEELANVFLEIDLEPLMEIKRLYDYFNVFDNLYKNPKELIIIWEESVSFFESLIKGYLDRKKV